MKGRTAKNDRAGTRSRAQHAGTPQNKRQRPGRPQIPVWPMYLLLVALVAAYIVVRSTGPLVLLVVVIIIIIESVNVVRSDSSRKGLIEVLVAVAVVLAIWAVLIVALGTTTPLDVVPSCSMLPKLHVGDMIVVQNSGVNSISATRVSVSRQAMDAYINKTASSTYECTAYNPADPSAVSQYVLPGYSVGLYSYNLSSGTYRANIDQSNNLIQFNCGTAQIVYSNGTTMEEAYTTSITVNGTTISEDLNNSVVVYSTVPSDLFYKEGDRYIVHRAYAVIDAQGTYYVLTKGDNNPGLDIQYMNVPPDASHINGRVVLAIPYLGYIKIALSGISPGSGCNYAVKH